MEYEDQVKIQFLCFSYAFEIYWAYYSQSSGHLFEEQTRKSLGEVLKIFKKLISLDKRYRDPELLALGRKSGVDEWLEKMESWVGSSRKWIYESPSKSRFLSSLPFNQIRGEIISDLTPIYVPSLMIVQPTGFG